jgi:succinate dehydrogenase/fumarate reductase cytochrome b subunit
MNSILAFYESSIGKKILMSLTGLFLIVFLTEHLVGNLLLFANDRGAMYEAYGEFLVSNPVIRFIEIFLFLGVLGHAVLGIILWIKNRNTRPVKYKFFRLKDNSPLASRTTILTGIVIGIFLYIHLNTFLYRHAFLLKRSQPTNLLCRHFPIHGTMLSISWLSLFLDIIYVMDFNRLFKHSVCEIKHIHHCLMLLHFLCGV